MVGALHPEPAARTSRQPRSIGMPLTGSHGSRLLFVLFVIVLAILSEAARASHIPREVREFLCEGEGPAAFCMALVAAITAAMAVNNSKKCRASGRDSVL